MSATAIESVRIRGFRSLADVELSGMPKATVLIGANGSGKSNVMRFFEMTSWMIRSRRLGELIAHGGGASDQLFGGSRRTPRMEAEIALRTDAGLNRYKFALSHAHPDRLLFSEESFKFDRDGADEITEWQRLGGGHTESLIVEAAQSDSRHLRGVNPETARVIANLLRAWSVYQFHDTSGTSRFKEKWDAGEDVFLLNHGGNLPAILRRIERGDIRRYEMICRQIGRILPGFDRFDIQESYGKVALRWKAKWSDKTFGAHLTSDGSLRFFALATLLNLPSEMLPSVVMLDEPELGLHPAAIELIGGMIQSLAAERQVIVATQSPLLVSAFDLDEIFTLDLHEGETKARKLSADDYRVWLEDGFTSGDLWRKNLLGGRP